MLAFEVLTENVLESLDDLNDAENDKVNSYGENTTNAPSTNAGEVTTIDDVQIAEDYATAEKYRRTRTGAGTEDDPYVYTAWENITVVPEPAIEAITNPSSAPLNSFRSLHLSIISY